jgi:hypothetical protein
VPLNSGTNLRLSSGEMSGDVQDVGVKGNSKVNKLLKQRAIAAKPWAEAVGTKQAPMSGQDPGSECPSKKRVTRARASAEGQIRAETARRERSKGTLILVTAVAGAKDEQRVCQPDLQTRRTHCGLAGVARGRAAVELISLDVLRGGVRCP